MPRPFLHELIKFYGFRSVYFIMKVFFKIESEISLYNVVVELLKIHIYIKTDHVFYHQRSNQFQNKTIHNFKLLSIKETSEEDYFGLYG